MKKFLCFCVCLFFFLAGNANASLYIPDERPLESNFGYTNSKLDVRVNTGDSYFVKYRYLEIFVVFLEKKKPSLKQAGYKMIYDEIEYDKEWRKKVYYPMIVKKLVVDRYREFIRRHKSSSFVPEAKLRIAEAYFRDGRKYGAAKRILDDIIKNYPNDLHYVIRRDFDLCPDGSCFRLEFSSEKTAAWALYYRVVWFSLKSRKNDIETILTKYKDSKEVVFEIRLFLKKLKRLNKKP